MRIYGLDCTSAPSRTKSFTCAHCELAGGTLRLLTLERLENFAAFEHFLDRPGPWVCGFDLPFGQPRKLVESLGWPRDWSGYVSAVAALQPIQAFERVLEHYRSGRPRGDKHLLRYTDVRARALSPMMLYGVPLARMFYQLMPRLKASSICILPCRPNDDNRIALEVYPRLVADLMIGREGSYKHDDRHKQTATRTQGRRDIIDGLRSPRLREGYGFDVELSDTHAAMMVQDGKGDLLDGLLCAIQAAWAATQPGYAISPKCDPNEGWIVDPISYQPATT